MKTKLAVFDMDGVIFKHHNFWMELHKSLGTLEEGIELTNKYVKKDYEKLVKEVIGRLWTNKPSKPYFDLISQHNYVKGAEETFKQIKKMNYITMLVSSGPYDLALRAQRDLNIDYIFANKLLTNEKFIVGSTDISLWPIKNDNKVEPLERVCNKLNISIKNVIAVIHDKNDIKLADYVKINGGQVIGFMFESHQEVEEHCTKIVRSDNLQEILVYF